MDYISAYEAAEKWGVSPRQVQRLLAAGRIPCAKKHGRDYLIPANAVKPGDPRFERLERGEPFHKTPLSRELTGVVTAINFHAPLADPDAILDMAENRGARVNFEMWFAYQRGEFDRVKQLFSEIPADRAVKLISAGTAIAGAISSGDYPFFIEIETWLKTLLKADVNAEVKALAEHNLSIAYTGMIAHEMLPEWLKTGNFSALPNLFKPPAACTRMQYLIQLKDYAYTLAAAQTCLSLCGTENAIYDPDTRMRIYCAEACFMTGREDAAKTYLRGAMKKSLPFGLITSFAERLIPLGGLCELLLKQEFPAHYDVIVNLGESATKNWIDFHNRFTKDNIPLILTPRDAQMARLAAQGWSDKRIAEHFNLAPGTVKNIMDKIYDTLFISGGNRKKKLTKFIL